MVTTISDGFFKDKWGTVYLIIKGKHYSKHQISASSATTVQVKDKEAYRSELSAFINSTKIIE